MKTPRLTPNQSAEHRSGRLSLSPCRAERCSALLVVLVMFSIVSSLRAADEPRFGYYELRRYTVTSNKLDGVLERFRDTVDPVRRKHGITTLGYWSAPGTTNGGTFA